MSELPQKQAFETLVEETYINPIRLVTVIDDEFPTIDALVKRELEHADISYDESALNKVQGLLDFFRNNTPPKQIDIFDGKNINLQNNNYNADFLSHSDLIILDYHLDGDESEDSEKALTILRNLAANDHFNLVVVYTKGPSFDKILLEIALGLTSPLGNLIDDVGKAKEIEDLLQEWEIDNPAILSQFEEIITEQAYLNFRILHNNCKALRDLPEYTSLLELFKKKPDKLKLNFPKLCYWLLHKKEFSISRKLCDKDVGNVYFEKKDKLRWIRTDKLFVAIIEKTEEPKQILDGLLANLVNWSPDLHRLLLTKTRALITQSGAIAESEILRDRFALAGWYRNLLIDEDKDRDVIMQTFRRHWESLGDYLTKDINSFGDRLIDYAKENGSFGGGVDGEMDQEKIHKHFNEYISNKIIDNSFLTTGHILEFSEENEVKKYCICLSPPCDMVHGQKGSEFYKKMGDNLPFMSVTLHPDTGEANRRANENTFIFLKVGTEIKCLSLLPGAKTTAMPHWEILFAMNKGKIQSNDTNKEIHILRLVYADGQIVSKAIQAKVVSQLRYEYALNLLQRLGFSLSRVGLDFHQLPKTAKRD